MKNTYRLLNPDIKLCNVFTGQDARDRVKQIGNPIFPSMDGLDVSGATFLMNDVVIEEGVVFAYSGFFRSLKPMWFQIWRPSKANGDPLSNPLDSNNTVFKILGQTSIVPTTFSREDVSYKILGQSRVVPTVFSREDVSCQVCVSEIFPL